MVAVVTVIEPNNAFVRDVFVHCNLSTVSFAMVAVVTVVEPNDPFVREAFVY